MQIFSKSVINKKLTLIHYPFSRMSWNHFNPFAVTVEYSAMQMNLITKDYVTLENTDHKRGLE